MSRQNDPHTPQISLSQIVASALAASSAAFAASYLGVAGTIIGAAVASVVVTVGSALFHSSFRRSSAAVRRTAQLVRPAPPAVPGHTPDLEHTRVLDIAAEPPRVGTSAGWRRTALAAAAVLGITLAGLTGLEAALGKPLSTLLGDSDASGTSLGSAVTGSHHHVRTTTGSGEQSTSGTASDQAGPTTDPTPTATPTSGPTPTAVPTATPSGDPTDVPTTGPTASPTDGPTDGASGGSNGLPPTS